MISGPALKIILKVAEILANIFISTRPVKNQPKGGNKK